MNLEELKQNWHKARVNNEMLEADNRRLVSQLATGRAQTARDKLSRYYRRSFICAILLPAFSPMLVSALGFPLWIAALYALFGVVMGVINLWFSNFISRCDYTSVPTVEALEKAVDIARYQRYIRSFGISSGGALIVTMFVHALDKSEYHTVIAFVIGLCAGIVIGVFKYRRMSSLVKQMQDELKSLVEE